ncbi:MAG TPA: UPF0158 family protein [Pyrinomonadaceae bacterium]|nr:UPF0158 family protein [Pyrinomonadaceae bacterium]
MPTQVKLDDVIDALDTAGEDHSHYLDKRTGEIVLITNEEMDAAEEDELISEYPEWQRESILKAREILKSEDFVALPDQFDIHEYMIMEDFCRQIQNRSVGETLLGLIKGSGAFKRFKNAIHSMGMEKDWYQFRRTEIEKLAIQWLEQEGLAYANGEVTDISETSMS